MGHAAPEPEAAPPPRKLADLPAQLPVEPSPLLPGKLTVSLSAERLSATLLNATLSYRIAIQNHGVSEVCAVKIFADMASAHGSIAQQDQLLIAETSDQPKHCLESLSPGESAVLSGDVRLPLAQVLPIRSGTAALFVPLLRLRLEVGDPGTGEPRISHHAFVIGQVQSDVTAALRPFQLDLGPRIYSEISQRELGLDGLASSR